MCVHTHTYIYSIYYVHMHIFKVSIYHQNIKTLAFHAVLIYQKTEPLTAMWAWLLQVDLQIKKD